MRSLLDFGRGSGAVTVVIHGFGPRAAFLACADLDRRLRRPPGPEPSASSMSTPGPTLSTVYNDLPDLAARAKVLDRRWPR